MYTIYPADLPPPVVRLPLELPLGGPRLLAFPPPSLVVGRGFTLYNAEVHCLDHYIT